MSPAARETSDREYARLRAELPLNQLRQALKLSQQQIAAEMGVSQAAISLLENREDLLVGTLRRFVEAMGGELELRAKFPSGEVTLDDLSSKGRTA
jgi:transcriptional regulator with XRE-family HTH domain